MTHKEIRIQFDSCQPDELHGAESELVEQAKEATRRAYAPYSQFHVGAALLLEDGTIVTGANQENAAYTSGTCAERSALFYASAQYPDTPIKAIAIAAYNAKEGTSFQRKPISPCGLCRQALLEYEHKYGPIKVYLYGEDEVLVFPSIGSLLPFSFVEF